jgi:outer membrane lipoprotein carrier protein
VRSSSARPTTRARAVLAALVLALAAADAPDDAAKTLDAVQKRYDSVQDLRASFAQTSFSAALGKESEARGTVVVKRPGKMRWEYAKPDGRVIVLDGSAIRIWSPAEKQLQIAPLSAENVSPTALGFLMGQTVLRDSFDVKPVSEPGRSERGLLLHPKSDAGFESLTLWLDPKTLQLRESTVVDLFGNRTRVRFEGIAENAGVEPASFEFATPAGADVIDLR